MKLKMRKTLAIFAVILCLFCFVSVSVYATDTDDVSSLGTVVTDVTIPPDNRIVTISSFPFHDTNSLFHWDEKWGRIDPVFGVTYTFYCKYASYRVYGVVDNNLYDVITPASDYTSYTYTDCSLYDYLLFSGRNDVIDIDAVYPPVTSVDLFNGNVTTVTSFPHDVCLDNGVFVANANIPLTDGVVYTITGVTPNYGVWLIDSLGRTSLLSSRNLVTTYTADGTQDYLFLHCIDNDSLCRCTITADDSNVVVDTSAGNNSFFDVLPNAVTRVGFATLGACGNFVFTMFKNYGFVLIPLLLSIIYFFCFMLPRRW